MKKFMILILSGVSVMALSGCGGGSDDGPVPETYFITDGLGYGVSDIIYHCDSGLSGVTNFEGAFTFDLRGDNCNFDLVTNIIVDDLFIEYDNDPNTDAGINGIYYECVANGTLSASGYTRYDPLWDVNGFIEDGSLHDGCTLFDIY
ncbi:hypothetical protein PF327_06605 [Sulfurovum sp. XTW-4]|uniref:CVNH domain-containing protein n=1 Tax=Sulfurovum xiamenensis TaxID=3019066 RepID=A0ABT7QSG9_9BACT|nr:hypothetical protein [Sulfurovum xiamenensis]MDM5263864.1 hypothetical protein [Sulfurovum xiamenensis]